MHVFDKVWKERIITFFVCDQFGLANGILGNVACNGAKPVGIFFLNFQVLDLPLWKQKS